MKKDMIQTVKTVAVILLVVAGAIGGMKLVSKLCCKKDRYETTECCSHKACGGCN